MQMTADVIQLNPPVKARLVCSDCGAPGEGSCHCGAPYIPPGQRAAEAVKANPGKSDRAIAAEIGVSDRTVNRARTSTATHDAVGPRMGADGKTRRMPQQSESEPMVREVEIDWPKYARDHVIELLKGLRQSMSKEDWNAFIDWMRQQKWRKK
jgi:hypothetical protein